MGQGAPIQDQATQSCAVQSTMPSHVNYAINPKITQEEHLQISLVQAASFVSCCRIALAA